MTGKGKAHQHYRSRRHLTETGQKTLQRTGNIREKATEETLPVIISRGSSSSSTLAGHPKRLRLQTGVSPETVKATTKDKLSYTDRPSLSCVRNWDV